VHGLSMSAQSRERLEPHQRSAKPARDARFRLYKTRMKFVAAPALIVPAGTAAATVVAQGDIADPALRDRQWTQIALLPSAERSRAIEAMLAAGILLRRHDTVLVLRIIREGQRYLAAVVAPLRSAAPHAEPSAEHSSWTPLESVVALDGALPEYTAALEAAARVRPLFHGTADDGCTYTGFAAEEPEVILGLLTGLLTGLLSSAAANSQLRNHARTSEHVTAYFSGGAVALPAGLVLVPCLV
jgi:hypothetical protein